MNRSSITRAWTVLALPIVMGVAVFAPASAFAAGPGGSPPGVLDRLRLQGLRDMRAYSLLDELITASGARLSGSDGAARAVRCAEVMMGREGFADVRQESVMVPHWERGKTETCNITIPSGQRFPLAVAALGGSIGTPARGISGHVIEVQSFEELRQRREEARGKIIFFNRAMDPTVVNTFEAYGGAVDQRSRGAVEAARVGGIAALVRSMTMRADDAPHTGAMGYVDSIPRVPAAALSIKAAERLSAILRDHPGAQLRLALSCRTLPDAPSANVMGEITGSEHPEEVIVVGGHLDCWDKGVGAHDDGSGCVQAIEALRLLKALGITPKRTIRAVMFMNEENGLRGGKGYVENPRRRAERHVAMVESDRGGFAPRGFAVQADSGVALRAKRWADAFSSIGAATFETGSSGVDISPMVATGVPGFGLVPENARYFDVHHSANDTLEAVNPRELELGAIAEAFLCYLLSEEGL